MPINDRGYIVAPSMFVPVGDGLADGDEESAWQQPTNAPQRQVPFKLAAVVPFIAFTVGAIVPLFTPSPDTGEGHVFDRVIIYQMKAEPLEPIAAVIPFDWYVQPSEPVRQLPRAVDEGGPAWIPEPEDTLRDLLTRWWQPASEPVRLKPRLVDEGTMARAPPDPFDFLPAPGWLPATNEPGRPLPRAVDEGGLRYVGPLLPTDDRDWQQPTNGPQRQLPRAVDVGAFVFPTELPPIADLDWIPRTPDPPKPLRRAVDEGGLSFVGELPPIADRDWFQPTNEPVRVLPPLRPDPDATQVEILPIAVVFTPPQATDVIRPIRRAVLEGGLSWVGELPPEADLDWEQPTNEPQRRLPRAVDVGVFVWPSEFPPIADRDWFQPTNEPVRLLPRAVDVGRFVTAPFNPTSLDFVGWLPATNEPVRLLPRLVDVGLFKFPTELPPIADLDWLPRTPDPPKALRAALREGGLTFVGELPPIADRDWLQPTNEPPNPLRRAVDAGLIVTGPFNPTSLDFLGWWRPASEPQRGLPPFRPQPDATQVEILPDEPPLPGFGWWRQTDEPGRPLPRLVDVGEIVSAPFNPLADGFLGWHPAPNEPPDLLRRAVNEGGLTFVGELPPIADVDWFQPTNDPQRQLARALVEGGLTFVGELPPIADVDWLPATNEPQRQLARLVNDGGLTFVIFNPTGLGFLGWHPATNEPPDPLPRLVNEGGLTFVGELPPIADVDWLPAPNEPQRQLLRAIAEGGLTFVGELPPIADFDWWRQPVERPRSLPPLRYDPDATQVEILPPAEIDLFRWWVQASEPVRRLPRLVDEGGLAFVGELPPIADVDWLPAPNEPPRQLARALVEGGLTFVAFDPTSENFLAWWRQPVERPRVLARPVDVGRFVQDFAQPIVIPDFGWFRPASEPVRSPAPLRPQFAILGSEPIVASFDWWRPAEEPVRTLARPVEQGWVGMDPFAQILPFVEGIFRQPAIPVLPIWTGAHLWVPPVQVEELPFPDVPIFQPLPLLLTFRDCAPIVISSERWPHQFNKFTVDALTGRGEVDALDPFPAPSAGGAGDPAIDPREPNLQRRHEWNL